MPAEKVMVKFYLHGPNAGATKVFNKRYPFKDGVYECEADRAEKVENVLARWYNAHPYPPEDVEEDAGAEDSGEEE